MQGNITRALPIAVALLALTACSNATGGSSSTSSTASNAPYRAACKTEDIAYQQASDVLDGDTSSDTAYTVLRTYMDQITAASTNDITGSKLWNDLNAEWNDVESLSVDLDIEQSSLTQDNLNKAIDDRKAIVADCKSDGYVYTTKME